MIVYVGDWIKTDGKWRQVVAADPLTDTFAVLGSDDDELMVWYGTDAPDVFDGHLSDPEMQTKLESIK